MFDVVLFSKQCRSGYINTVRCLCASDAKSCVCLAYDNEQTETFHSYLTPHQKNNKKVRKVNNLEPTQTLHWTRHASGCCAILIKHVLKKVEES